MSTRKLKVIETTELPDKLPPQNIEAEQSVLGCLLMDKEAIIKVADILKTGDFYKDRHNIIYSAMLDLYEKNEPIDLLSLISRLKEKKQIEKAGGHSYLTEIINAVPTAAHVAHYAKIVRKKKTLRDLIGLSHDIAHLGYEENNDLEVILDIAEQKMFTLSQRSLSNQFHPLKNTLEEAFTRLDKLHKEGSRMRGLPTYLSDLDNYLSGMQKSDLVILAARPSLGKTALALDVAKNVAINSKTPVGIFSLEMSKHDLIDRLLAKQAEIELCKLRTGHLSSRGEYNDFERIQEAIGSLSEAPIFIDDSPSPNIMQIKTMARRLQAEKGLGLIIVDYLQMIQPRDPNIPPVQQITEISRSLKNMARELEVPVLALSQLSRAVEARPNQRPRLSDLRDSGSIEQDADVVLFIYREDKINPNTQKPNIAEIIIAKHRNGPTGNVNLYFDQKVVSFKNLDKHHGDYPENFTSAPQEKEEISKNSENINLEDLEF